MPIILDNASLPDRRIAEKVTGGDVKREMKKNKNNKAPKKANKAHIRDRIKVVQISVGDLRDLVTKVEYRECFEG